MKKQAYMLIMLTGISAIYFTGCKEDGTAPTITLNGNAHVITQKGVQYSDAGATASDNKDESVYVMSNLSTSNPDIDIAGDYTVTYTAQDRAANSATVSRTVSVTYTQWQLNHNYNVTDICISDTMLNATYVSSVISDSNFVYRTSFTNMTNFFGGNTYMEPVGAHITLPKQKPNGISSPFVVEGSGAISENTGIITISLYYTLKDTTNSQPDQNRHAVFVSF